MANLPTVAVAGATGKLGSHVIEALLSASFRSCFRDVVLLTRRPAADGNEWIKKGAKVIMYSENDLRPSLAGVDIVISTIGASGHHFKQKLLEAMVGSSVSLYFPSEFGVDHTLHDFPHAEWDAKKRHYDLAKIVPDIKICRVFIGLLLEDSIGPWFGYDTTNSAYEAVGSSDTGVSFTAFTDVGRVVATLATLAVSKVPDSIRVGGDTISMRKTALIMEAAGAGPVKVTQISLPEYKSAVLAEGKTTPEKFLRFLMGEGKINHDSGGLGNGNELVNPGGRSWQWKTMSNLAEETNGKPWFGTIWNLA